jgi:phosphatidylglycerol---prolipoprotein diacylglyceryl transferase
MCSELFRIPYSWGGVPIFGFGVLLAIWAVVGIGGIALLVRKHGWTAEIWSFVPLLVFTGAAIVGLPRLFPDGMPIRGYGVMVLLGATSGVAMATYRAKRIGLNPEIVWSMAVWLLLGGVIGARLFYVIEYWDERFRTDSLWRTIALVLNFPEGGLVVYGALFGGLAAIMAFARKHRLPFLAICDLIAPSFAIGLALGRIGCLLNGCCYGGPADLPWSVTFPTESLPYRDQVESGQMYGFQLAPNPATRAPTVVTVEKSSVASKAGLKVGDVPVVINGAPTLTMEAAADALGRAFHAQQSLAITLADGGTMNVPATSIPPRSRPVHPTQVYSAITAGLLAWFLWTYYPYRRRDGEVFALLLTIYPISRFLEEIIRTDEPAVFGTGLSISQNISLGVAVVVLGLWIYILRQPRGVAWPAQAAA